MKSLFRILTLGLSVFSLSSNARDKIGNGGGVWICGAGDHAIQDIKFVDFFEAADEFKWTLKDFKANTFTDAVNLVSHQVSEEFPNYHSSWKNAVDMVLKKIVFVDIELELIDDALFRARPLASLCPHGPWRYGQLANFNEFNTISIRNDYWNHLSFSITEKAGLIWHEAIYYWLRENFNEEDSVKARYITGLLFSDLESGKKRALLNEVLDGGKPPPNDSKWFCMIRNNITHLWHEGYGATKTFARGVALRKCQSAGNSFHCDDLSLRCEPLAEEFTSACTIENTLSGKEFFGEGRSRLEAMFNSYKACEIDEPSKVFHCQSATWACE